MKPLRKAFNMASNSRSTSGSSSGHRGATSSSHSHSRSDSNVINLTSSGSSRRGAASGSHSHSRSSANVIDLTSDSPAAASNLDNPFSLTQEQGRNEDNEDNWGGLGSIPISKFFSNRVFLNIVIARFTGN
jgi:hypothetical protein